MIRTPVVVTLACALLLAAAGCADDEPHTVGCTVTGYVPSTSVTVTEEDPRVLYSRTIAVAAGRTSTGSDDASLEAYPPVDPGLRVDSPPHAALDAATSNAVLDRVVGSTLLDGVRGLSWDLANHGAGTRRYLVYAGATVRRGSWEARRCSGGSVTTYRGTFTKIGTIATGHVRCLGRPEGPDLGGTRMGGQNLLRGAASRAACRPTPQSYRQFHEPSA